MNIKKKKKNVIKPFITNVFNKYKLLINKGVLFKKFKNRVKVKKYCTLLDN